MYLMYTRKNVAVDAIGNIEGPTIVLKMPVVHRCYDKSKDASRDAEGIQNTVRKRKAIKKKAYAKKERGEIKKDDPDWKHKKGHTGMHGEAKDSFVVPSSASPSKAAPGEGGIPKPSDAKIDGDVKNDKKKEHKDAKKFKT